MDIKHVVSSVCRKYNTTDPFQIAVSSGIKILYLDLGKTYGFFHVYHRMPMIVLNQNLPEQLMRFVCSHELGHSFLHRGVNTPYLKAHTLFSIDKIEREANTFAVELLLPDDILRDNEGINFYTLAQCAGIPEGLESLKILQT